MKHILYLPAFLLLFSCNTSEVKNSESKTENTPAISNAQKLLSDYTAYIAGLDSMDVESSGKAARQYQELFKGQAPGLCDSAYLLFDGFYERMDRNLNTLLEKDTTSYDELVIHYYDSTRAPVSKTLLDYNQKLKDNGFQIAMDEGMTYVAQYRLFIVNSFGPLVSKAMKDYLTETDLETEEGFSSDGGMIISVSRLADRIVWWEKFINANPDFIELSKAKELKKTYLTYLFNGMDNTPLYEDAETMTLSGMYVEGYQYLLSKYPDTQAASLVNPFYTAVKQKQKSRVEALIEQYKKQDLILGFGY
ncbi:MAG: hypothetical protein ACJ75J_16835 [Cytophagaceae bacterium]